MDITKGQKRILTITAIIIVLFVIFWLFVYFPAKNSVRALKAELLEVENKIGALEAIIGKDKPMEEGLSMLQKQLIELDSKFPDNEEETLRIVSNIAYKSGLNVISIKPQPKKLFLDKEDNAIRIEDKLCQKMPISMVVRSTYKKLGKFLEALREEIPHLLTIERLQITKESKQRDLKTDINLTMYFLAEEKK